MPKKIPGLTSVNMKAGLGLAGLTLASFIAAQKLKVAKEGSNER